VNPADQDWMSSACGACGIWADRAFTVRREIPVDRAGEMPVIMEAALPRRERKAPPVYVAAKRAYLNDQVRRLSGPLRRGQEMRPQPKI